MENKELVQSNGNAVSTDVVDLGIANELSFEDIGVGRICLMQSNSNLVKAEQAKQATLVDILSPTKILGDKVTPMEVVIVDTMKYWITQDAETQKFISREPAISNENEKPWKEHKDGRDVKNMFNRSFIVILPSEVAGGAPLPYEISFRSTTLKYGKQILKIIKDMADQKIPSWAKTFKIGINPTPEVDGKNSWFVPTVSIGRDATIEEMKAVQSMRSALSTVKEKIMTATDDAFSTGGTSSGTTEPKKTEF